MTLFLSEKDVTSLLTMDAALDAVEEGFRQQAEGKATNGLPSSLPLPRGSFHLVSSAMPALGVMGVRAFAAERDEAGHSHLQLSSTLTGELLALLEAIALGQVAAGAAAGVAAKYMAREHAAAVGLLGSTSHALAQLEAICQVRQVRAVHVFDRTSRRTHATAAGLQARFGFPVEVSESAQACLAASDIVVAGTCSARPLVRGRWLQPGTHISVAASHKWGCRAVDDEAFGRSGHVVADDVEQAKLGPSNIAHAVDEAILRWEQVRSLAEVIAGRALGRAGEGDVSIFELQGTALADVAAGFRVYRLALAKGTGRELSF